MVNPIEWIDLSALYFSVVAGALFGVFVYYKGDDESSWHDIVSWGFLVWVTFIGLANLNRFVEGNPEAMEHLFTGGIRWWAFIFTIVAAAGTMRHVRNRRMKRKEDCDGQS